MASALASDEPLLVLCRTAATVNAVYRFLAEELATKGQKGFPGLRVTTPLSLMGESAPGHLLSPADGDAVDELPEGHPWRKQFDGRPGLLRMLHQHMGRIHEAALAGVALEKLRPELRALLDAVWAMPPHLEGARRLLANPPTSRCVAVGFPPSPLASTVTPLLRALLNHLKPTHVDDGAFARAAPLPACRVADVAAEARAVAREAGPVLATEKTVLVLVASTATEERIRAALSRNGIATADDAAEPLRRHALASVARPLLPLFLSRGTEPLDAEHLLRVLTDPVLARTAPVPAGEDVSLPKPRASVKHLREMIVSCRCVRAPLAGWQTMVAALVKESTAALRYADEDTQPDRQRRLESAQVLQVRLEQLARYSKGEGTIGELSAFLSAVGLSDPENDRLGRAILRALGASHYRPATDDNYDDALSSALGSGRVDRGVEILSYDAYDGRHADLLLLADVHNKGISAAPAPDPILTVEELALLGIPSAAERVKRRLGVVRWAATRAEKTLALVTATDGSGRAVSPPLELQLEPVIDDSRGSYGLAFDLPEIRDCGVLAEGDGKSTRLAMQADVEWARRGAWFSKPAPPATEEDPVTLPEHLERGLPRIPADLLPWLGKVQNYPASSDGLPEGFTLSASRCAGFTQCLFKAFCQSVLRLKAPEEIEEDLSAAELGQGIHAAMKDALKGESLLVPAKNLDSTRKRICGRLVTAIGPALEKDAPEAPALALSRKGQGARWGRYFATYLERRVCEVGEATNELRTERTKGLKNSPAVEAVVDILVPGLKATPRSDLTKLVLQAAADFGNDVEAFLKDTRLVEGMAKKHQPVIQTSLLDKKTRKKAETLCAEAEKLLVDANFAGNKDLTVVAGEHPFGETDAESAPLQLKLGRKTIQVRGFIDLVLHHQGADPGDGAAYQIVDFKTGKTVTRLHRITDSVIEPQLAMYTLALEALNPIGSGQRGPVRVTAAELDYVRAKAVQVWMDEPQRQHWRKVLGAVLDHARGGFFPPLPHPEGCPLLTERQAYCDFAEICRFRPDYQPSQGEEETP
jgi:hypothetical protein